MSVFYYNSGSKLFTFGSSTSGAREARIETVTVSESNEYADGGTIKVGTKLVFTVTGWIVGSSETDLKNKIRYARESLSDSAVYLAYQHQSGAASYAFSPWPAALESNSATPAAAPSRGTPKPVNLSFKRFAGDTTVAVEFQVEVFSTEPLGGNFPAGVKALWYDTRVTYDENYVPTMVVAGTIEINEEFDNWSIPAYIDIHFPRVKFWKRAPVEYQWSSTGHTIEFAFTDKMLKRELRILYTSAIIAVVSASGGPSNQPVRVLIVRLRLLDSFTLQSPVVIGGGKARFNILSVKANSMVCPVEDHWYSTGDRFQNFVRGKNPSICCGIDQLSNSSLISMVPATTIVGV